MLLTGSLLAVAVALIPLVYLGVRAAEAGGERIRAELLTGATAELAATSLALAALVTAGCLLLGVGAAFLVTRTDLPLRRTFGVVAALPLAMPTYVAAFGWVSVVDGFHGFWPAALVLTFCSFPYVYLPVAAALRSVDPAVEEVSQSLGRGGRRTFTGVTLRQIRPAVVAGGLLVTLYVLSDFGAVALLRVNTFTRSVFTSFDLGFDRVGALVQATALVVVTLVILGAELAVRRHDTRYAKVGGGTRRPARIVRLGPWRAPALLAIVAVAAGSFAVPGAALVRWTAEGVSRPGSPAEIAGAAANSMGVSALGAALTMLLALPIGLLTARAPGPLSAVLDRLTYLTHALPGLVVGLSLVFFGINVAYPLYQTRWLLALAYATLFLPLAVGAVASAAALSPPSLEEAARSLGRGPWAVLRTVTLPLTLPGIGAGAALVFLTCMKELPATLLLRPTGMDTLATELWTHTSVAAYAAASPYAALLVILSAGPVLVLARRALTPGGTP
ncbi:iron ABC transporter permease [Catellatospora coxensis]|uniref:ABC transporter permease n=1 Tax=Catellatospora coxensis TaxID=310354 RepID=A0A8J3P528_9ACTN|nr:ABC transporter permease [Catellatospora coxensis]